MKTYNYICIRDFNIRLWNNEVVPVHKGETYLIELKDDDKDTFDDLFSGGVTRYQPNDKRLEFVVIHVGSVPLRILKRDFITCFKTVVDNRNDIINELV